MSSFIVGIHEGRLPFYQRYLIVFSFTSVDLQMLVSFAHFQLFHYLPGWWWRRICGGGCAGYVVGEIKNKANSAQLELELGLSLAIRLFSNSNSYHHIPNKLALK